MKYKIFLIILIIILAINTNVKGASLKTDIIKENQENFGISEFVNETDKYTGDFFEGTNVSDLLNSAISGKVDNSTIIKRILNIFGKELLKTIRTLVGVLIIILIHSILKAISEGLENTNISKIIYYAQYILIITLIMNNFSELILSITNTINNLVGFMNTLIPILMTLMIYTGSITTSRTIRAYNPICC